MTSRTRRPVPSRRLALKRLGAVLAAAPLGATIGCGSDPATPTAPSGGGGTTPPTGGGTSQCVEAATETRGPYPDMTGMVNNQAFYRQDVREGRPGTTLTLALTVVNVRNACAPVGNAAVEMWQCDAEGRYSEYAQGNFDGRGQTFLRGLQITDSAGRCTFTTVYPGWYQGRATHIHVDVLVGGQRVKSTQMAFPEDVTAQVYAQGVYASRGGNPTTNARDNVFSDGTSTEMAAMTGSPATGYTATLQLGISV